MFLIEKKNMYDVFIKLNKKYNLYVINIFSTLIFGLFFGATAPSGPGPAHSRGF